MSIFTQGFIRIFSLLVTLFLIFIASRAMIRALPGDPLETVMAETGTSIPPEELRAELNLDQPFFLALADDLEQMLQGNWGKSILSRKPILPMITERFLNTLELTLAALALGLSFSLILGLLAAEPHYRKINRISDRFCTYYGAFAAALPTPWIGPILIYVFALVIPIFPLGGDIVLPAITLAIGFSGLWARLIRERVRETLILGAAVGAKARGIPQWKVVFKYGLIPASGALLAYLGTQIGGLLAGAFITEVIFNWQGMGALLVDSVLGRDYPVVEAAVFLSGAMCLIGNTLGDCAKALIDPREELR